MQLSENEFRDYLFTNYKENISDLIVGKRKSITWSGEDFPPIYFLLQQRTENRINEILENIEDLILTASELRLNKAGDTTTRVDLFGNSESCGITIIELKKSKQTERQAFTELLAYANHFCSVFPGLKENSITSILIAPMETRTVKDAYVQELVANNKNALSLIPVEKNGKIELSVYYPDSSYYQWFENNLFDDRSMLTVAISFSIIEGWIDSDVNNDKKIPDYSKSALNTISNSISHKLESDGIHSIVYASQKWGEIGELFPYPNTIFIAAINPFSSFRTSIDENEVCGESKLGRIEEVQMIHNQLSENDKEFWIETAEANFQNRLIQITREEFELCFKNNENIHTQKEISLPDWYGLKTSMIDSVFTHNLDIHLSGMLRDIYSLYITHVFENDEECIYYGTDLPKYSYQTLREFLPVWKILSGLGHWGKNA